VGAIIADRYEIQRHLGGGGSAQTYAAVEKTTRALVAIKVFTLRGGAWKSFELFEREAAVLARLDPPAIPRLIESFTADTEQGPTFYLVESFVEGRTLADETREHRLDEAGARKVAVELLGILGYLQGLSPPVVHRDIKPANILRLPSGGLALVDFGSVRAKDPNAETAATTIVGTYGFMAPEQYRGIAVPATDLHGVGATLVYLLTGRTPDALPQQKLRPVLPDDLSLTPQFKAWLGRLLEPAPEDRTRRRSRV
jgi:serine/threonine protein kinase